MSITPHTIGAKGIGWVTGTEYGTVLHPQRVGYGGGVAVPPWKQTALFPSPLKNAGRFDGATRMILSACALALQDAGDVLGEGKKGNIGLLGTNTGGCVAANRAYFKDYLEGGRTLARANLFVYTLPSSPLAEVAIHFGLQGPVLYIGYAGTLAGSICGLLETGDALLKEGAVEGVLLVSGDERSAVAVFLGQSECGDPACGLDKLMARFERGAIWSDNTL